MIVTVTPNTGIDQTLIIPSFELNRTIRTLESHIGMGSKGADVSWILGNWGISSLATGFAAGAIGRQMEEMLIERGVQTDFVWVNGSTRWNTIILCADGSGQSTLTTSTLSVSDNHLSDFDQKLAAYLPRTTCLVLSGTTPKGVPLDFYPNWIRRAREMGIPVLFDSSEPFLRVGLEAGPYLVKPNQHELEELCGEKAMTRQDIYRLARQLQEKYHVNLIATTGKEGAFALLDNKHYWIPALEIKPVSTAGAGDAVVAGMAAAISRGESIEDGLRLAFALASAMLLTAATGDFRREDALRFLEQVQLIRL
jgi:1-phosphofructokinase